MKTIVNHAHGASRMIGIIAVLLVSLIGYANDNTWSTTSSMQGFNSGFAPNLTDVNASSVAPIRMQSTSSMKMAGYTPSLVGEGEEPALVSSGPRRGFGRPDDPGQSDESPVGEPWVMVAFAALAAGWIAWRQRAKA